MICTRGLRNCSLARPELPAFEIGVPRGESSNQLLESLEEWNDHLERYAPLVLQERLWTYESNYPSRSCSKCSTA